MDKIKERNKIEKFKRKIKERIEIWLNSLYKKDKSWFYDNTGMALIDMFINGYVYGAFENSKELDDISFPDEVIKEIQIDFYVDKEKKIVRVIGKNSQKNK